MKLSGIKTVLYFGAYDPAYSRNRALIKGLRSNGIRVIECNDRSPRLIKYFKLLFKYWNGPRDFDVMIVGFPGQEIMPLAAILTRRPIIFDSFTSHFGGYILDRKYFKEGSPAAYWYRFMDVLSCWLADKVLLDTRAHINFFTTEFGIPREKFLRVFVGTASDLFYPGERSEGDKFKVHFHGTAIPLQGISYIIRAAKILEDKGVFFTIIGTGQTHADNVALAMELNLKNVTFIDRVPYEELASHINQADIALGIFGDTPKTALVIPNKVFEAMACGKAIISADTPAMRELFTEGENIVLCRAADPEDLARKILELKNDKMRRAALGEAVRSLFLNQLTEHKVVNQLLQNLREGNSLSQ